MFLTFNESQRIISKNLLKGILKVLNNQNFIIFYIALWQSSWESKLSTEKSFSIMSMCLLEFMILTSLQHTQQIYILFVLLFQQQWFVNNLMVNLATNICKAMYLSLSHRNFWRLKNSQVINTIYHVPKAFNSHSHWYEEV